MHQKASLLVIIILCLYWADARTKPLLNIHHHMTEAELQKFFGVSSHDQVPEYEIAQSFAADGEGIETHPRPKRDSESSARKSFTLKGHESSMHLNLKQDNDVKSPSLVVRTYHEDGSRTDSDASDVEFYNGHVTGHPGSKVSVTERDGRLTGAINLHGDVLHVHPLPTHLAKAHGYKDAGTPHVIHRVPAKHDLAYDESLASDNNTTPPAAVNVKVLEMTLEADQFVIGVYGKDTVEHLLLVAHITRNLFLDSTIGPIKINLVIIGIILKKDGFGYDDNASMKRRLDLFSEWTDQNLPMDDTEPDHPDTAILLSRGITGYALLSSTCNDDYHIGRAAVGDKGLGTATVLAHETAHTLGTKHDGDLENRHCPDYKNIMASLTSSGSASFTWSNCSRDTIQKYLSGPKSKCLNDEPHKSIHNEPDKNFVYKLPGEVKNRTVQCQMMHGKKYANCRNEPNNCEILKCEKEGNPHGCLNLLMPPAEGSKCGPRHWCIKGKCEDNGRPSINGGWSSWSTSFSPCSRTCGSGVQSRSRKCNNPKSSNGGKPCQGEVEGHWKLCNTKACPPGTVDYRLSQCKDIDSTFNGVYYDDNHSCILVCRKGPLRWPPKGSVKDGTRCSSDPVVQDVCIKGKCRKVGCDGKIDSGLKSDRCGVCNGDSAKCARFTGEYTDPCKGHGPEDICLVLSLPIGSRIVKVEKKKNDGNSFLGIQDKNRRYITPNFPTWTTKVDVAGTRVYYYREPDDAKDRIEIPGPTKEQLYIVNMPLYVVKPNQGIDYSLILTNQTTEVKIEDFEWKASKWTPCSKTCGQGHQSRTVDCARKDDGSYVGDHVCEAVMNKPAVSQVCNAQACSANWHTSAWKPCSKTCGGGFQIREIICRQELADNVYRVLHHASCPGSKPTGDVKKTCNKIACPEQWVASTWSRCSTSCGRGTMSRSLSCQLHDSHGNKVRLHPSLCASKPRPVTRKPCNQDNPCPTPPTEPPPKNYVPLGCYNDGTPRAIPEQVLNLRAKIDWKNLNKTIDACAEYVHSRFPRHKVFSIQFYGECWTGETADETYSRYGESSNCVSGVGRQDTLYAYRFRETVNQDEP